MLSSKFVRIHKIIDWDSPDINNIKLDFWYFQIEDLLQESMEKQIEDKYEFVTPHNETGVINHGTINLAWDRVQHQVTRRTGKKKTTKILLPIFNKWFEGHQSFLWCHWYPLTDTPTLNFWWCLSKVSKPGWIPFLCAFLPTYNGFLRFTSDATPADFLMGSIAAEPLWSIYLYKHWWDASVWHSARSEPLCYLKLHNPMNNRRHHVKGIADITGNNRNR